MDRNKWILLAIIGLVGLLAIIFLLPEKTRKKYTKTGSEVESFYARAIASSKYAETGVEPKTSNEPKISPASQKLFLNIRSKS